MVSEQESRVTLKVGEEHQIRLAGLATAGYQWSCEVEGTREAVEVKKSWGPTPDRLVGESADEIFTVTALRPGRAVLRFEQRRRWEQGSPPVHRAIVHVDVID
jgi:predicted secreted protein